MVKRGGSSTSCTAAENIMRRLRGGPCGSFTARSRLAFLTSLYLVTVAKSWENTDSGQAWRMRSTSASLISVLELEDRVNWNCSVSRRLDFSALGGMEPKW